MKDEIIIDGTKYRKVKDPKEKDVYDKIFTYDGDLDESLSKIGQYPKIIFDGKIHNYTFDLIKEGDILFLKYHDN